MVIDLAIAFGQPVQQILEQPYVITLWSWMELQEKRRVDRLYADNAAIHQAYLIGAAVNDPGKLTDADFAWRQKAGLVPSPDEALQRAQQMVRELETATVVET